MPWYRQKGKSWDPVKSIKKNENSETSPVLHYSFTAAGNKGNILVAGNISVKREDAKPFFQKSGIEQFLIILKLNF